MAAVVELLDRLLLERLSTEGFQMFPYHRPSDFEIHFTNTSQNFAVHSEVLSKASRYFATVCDKNKFEEGKIGRVVLTHDWDVVEQLLRSIYQQPVDWLKVERDDFRPVASTAVKKKYLNIMRLREAADYYELRDLHAETTKALKAIFDGVEQADVLTWMGRDAHDNADVAGHAVLWEVQNETRKRIKWVLLDRHAWPNLYANEEYVKKVTCGLAGCDGCRRALPH
ncbi:hypothetical protein PRZ48_010868 [Zasmidium cellare]|uniref:BTB domain-containing protein n=1 Tax=Zasmidium cellare TaxID=395010 RepID=A0ABR0E9W6_ZASCE|nr:hypothetical protein PRZ48_010868 [Zasmidium cellare]